MHSPNSDEVEIGARNATQIWGLISKFIMLDRFSQTLGAAEVYPGLSFHKTSCSIDYIGTGIKVSAFLSNSINGQAKIALSLSRRLNHVVKVKKLLAIESGMAMIALAMIVSSEVCNFDIFESLLFIFLT